MTSLEAALRQIDADLSEARVAFALVGGLAVSARTEPRFTRDADLAVALKVLSRDDITRPQDLGDLRALLRVASSAELTRARQSIALIVARGYHRGRDLVSEMNTLLPPAL